MAKRLSPAEWATLAILAVATAVIGIRLPGRPLLCRRSPCTLRCSPASRLRRNGLGEPAAAPARNAAPRRGSGDVHPLPDPRCRGFRVMRGPATRSSGRSTPFLGAPTLLAARHLTFGRLETLSFFYGLFIPVLYLSISSGSWAGPTPSESSSSPASPALRSELLGYLLLPSHGPIELLAGVLPPLAGGRFHALILRSVASTGGNLGAFPSLHVGATAYTILFDRRHNRLRALTYVRSSC